MHRFRNSINYLFHWMSSPNSHIKNSFHLLDLQFQPVCHHEISPSTLNMYITLYKDDCKANCRCAQEYS